MIIIFDTLNRPNQLVQIPFNLKDRVHPNFWRLELPLPENVVIIGISTFVRGIRRLPMLIALVRPAEQHFRHTFLIASGYRPVHDSSPYLKRVRYIDAFELPAGRLGAIGWRSFRIYEVNGPNPPASDNMLDLPVIAHRTTIEDMFPSLDSIQ